MTSNRNSKGFHKQLVTSMKTKAMALWLMMKQYKLIVAYDDGESGKAIDPELYDLLNDPFERNSLYGKLPEVYESLRVKLETWRPVNK